jgi:hypothetical protein
MTCREHEPILTAVGKYLAHNACRASIDGQVNRGNEYHAGTCFGVPGISGGNKRQTGFSPMYGFPETLIDGYPTFFNPIGVGFSGAGLYVFVGRDWLVQITDVASERTPSLTPSVNRNAEPVLHQIASTAVSLAFCPSSAAGSRCAILS